MSLSYYVMPKPSSGGHFIGLITGESWQYNPSSIQSDLEAVLLIIRTCAIWNNDKRVIFGLSFSLFAVSVPAAYSGVAALLELRCTPTQSIAHQMLIIHLSCS